MNILRRKRLAEILSSIEDLKSDLEDVLFEEEEYRDNIPENLQGSTRYEVADEACDSIQSAIDALDEATDYITEIEGVE